MASLALGASEVEVRQRVWIAVAVFGVLFQAGAHAQGLTGALIGTVRDAQGGVLPGAVVTLRSAELMGGQVTTTTSERGQLRFPTLPPGRYALRIELRGFSAYEEKDIVIGAGATLERSPVLHVAGFTASTDVTTTTSHMDVRQPGLGTRFTAEDLAALPTRRSSMFDAIRGTPGISPTSPSSGTVTTFSAFGSGTNENQFLIDGTNFTCPCNGVARSEPGVDFMQEIQVQSMGASVEFGNFQGAVVNVITRQGGDRFVYEGAFFGQPAALTSGPVRSRIAASADETSTYQRDRYHDFTASAGGPLAKSRVWFFAGYQYLRDYDSQPGTVASLPRKYEQDKVLAKLTWQLRPSLHLLQSFHEEFFSSPEQPTLAKPFEATFQRRASVPAITFGHLTHTLSPNTVWDVRVGYFGFTQKDTPSTGDPSIQGRSDSAAGTFSAAPLTFGDLVLSRLTSKATLTHYRGAWLGGDHEWKIGVQAERGAHHSAAVIPGGARLVDVNQRPSDLVSSAPSNIGGVAVTISAFVSDTLTVNDRITINAGVRFDHSRAGSQDLPRVDEEGDETPEIVAGRGTLFTWNVWSPRLGVIAKLTADGRTILRASYGRFSQGVLTGEIQPFHPGATAITTRGFNGATGRYDGVPRIVDPTHLRLDSELLAPTSDELSIGVDREFGANLAVAAAYVRKNGRNFIGWTEVGGRYHEEMRSLAGHPTTVYVLDNAITDRRYLLTNPPGYSLSYDGLVLVAEKRRSHGWQAFSSYTFSRTAGLLASSGANAAGAQASTVAPPPAPSGLTFGRDPNDLTNARGRLPNDRPHIFRVSGSAEVPLIRVAVAVSFQYFSGKPWAASALAALPQTGNRPQQRILLEPRGSRRLPSQSLLDLRVARPIALSEGQQLELMLDVLNLLNDSAAEAIVTDNLADGNFGTGAVFMDPRRVMLGIRYNFGR